MKFSLLFLVAFVPTILFGQVDYTDSIEAGYSFLENNQLAKAYSHYNRLERSIPESDSNYIYAAYYLIQLAADLEKGFRMNEEFMRSLELANRGEALLNKNVDFFDQDFMKRLPFQIKNQVVAYSGLKEYDKAQLAREKMYQLHQLDSLPEGIDEFYNFDFFTFDTLNIWGYEWFADLPEDRFESSFTKVVYYVYSTDDSGQDKAQLYRLHVLMYHGMSDKFDYVLTKRIEEAKNERGGTLWCYTYKEDIDFAKLQADIKRILAGELNPCLEKD